MSQKYADGNIHAYLSLSDSLAGALGVSKDVEFSDLNPQQFIQLVKAYDERMQAFGEDEANQMVKGVGQVTYLEQARAEQFAQAVKSTATVTLKALTQELRPLLDQMPSVDPMGIQAGMEWFQGKAQRDAEEMARLMTPLPGAYDSGGAG